MINEKEISLSSFLAGFLLVKDSIGYLEISNGMSQFEHINDLEIVEDRHDFCKLKNLIVMNDMGISLTYNYNDEYKVNNTPILVKDYLYDLTNEDVRKYFNIEEKEIINIYNGSKKVKKYSKFIKFKRTKVYI